MVGRSRVGSGYESAFKTAVCDPAKVIEPGSVADRLMAEARSVLHGHLQTRHESEDVIVDLTRDDGTVLWPNYASGPNELLAVLAAEQRYLVEEEGRGSVPGPTYLDKAHERVGRAGDCDGS